MSWETLYKEHCIGIKKITIIPAFFQPSCTTELYSICTFFLSFLLQSTNLLHVDTDLYIYLFTDPQIYLPFTDVKLTMSPASSLNDSGHYWLLDIGETD